MVDRTFRKQTLVASIMRQDPKPASSKSVRGPYPTMGGQCGAGRFRSLPARLDAFRGIPLAFPKERTPPRRAALLRWPKGSKS